MIKRLAVILVMIMLVTGISGCTGSGTDKGKAKGTTEVPQKAVEARASTEQSNLAPATLTFYIPGEERPDAKEVLAKAAEKSGLNIRLDFKYINGIYSNGIQLVLASNDPIDVMYVGMPESYELTGGSPSYIDAARDGRLMDITDLLPEYAPNICSQLDKTELENARIDGKLYFIPSLYPMVNNICAFVNMDFMNKYKIGPLNTFEDYGAYLKTIKENEPDIIPGQVSFYNSNMITTAYGYVLLDSALNLVYKWDDPDMKLIPWERTEEFRNFMKMFSGWQKNGYLTGPNDGIDKKRASYLSAGTLLKEQPVITTNSDGTRIVKDDSTYGYILYKDAKINRGNPVGSIYNKGALAISSNSRNARRVLEFLDWVQSSQESYDLLMYGIEGRHYTLDGEFLKYPEEEADKVNTFYPYWHKSPFLNINYVRTSRDNAYSSEDYRKNYTDFIFSKTAYAPSTGFYPDYRPISAEVQRRASKFEQLVSYPINQGNFNSDNIDSIIKQLKEAGTDKIVAELQKQLDRWKASR